MVTSLTPESPAAMAANYRGRRTAELTLLIFALCLLDLFFTLWAQRYTDFGELNPVAGQFLSQGNTLGLIVYKLFVTFTGTSIFWMLRRHRLTELAAWAMVIVHVLVMIRWSQYAEAAQPLLKPDYVITAAR